MAIWNWKNKTLTISDEGLSLVDPPGRETGFTEPKD